MNRCTINIFLLLFIILLDKTRKEFLLRQLQAPYNKEGKK